MSGVVVAHDDQVDVLDADAGILHRLAAGGRGEVGGVLALGGDVALPDAGALHDPLVGRVDESWRARHWS